MLRVTRPVVSSGGLKPGIPTPRPTLSLGLLAKYLRTRGVPAACLVAQAPPRARARQMVLETDMIHMTTLSSFRRSRGRKEHSGRRLCWALMPENQTSAFAGTGATQLTASGNGSFSRAALRGENDLGALQGEAPLTGLRLPRPWLWPGSKEIPSVKAFSKEVWSKCKVLLFSSPLWIWGRGND